MSAGEPGDETREDKVLLADGLVHREHLEERVINSISSSHYFFPMIKVKETALRHYST